MGLISKLRIRNSLVREFLAELLGTFVLIVLGDGAVAQMVLTQKTLATYLSVNFGYAMAVAFGVYVSGGVSGGHINPAVTLVMAVIGKTHDTCARSIFRGMVGCLAWCVFGRRVACMRIACRCALGGYCDILTYLFSSIL